MKLCFFFNFPITLKSRKHFIKTEQNRKLISKYYINIFLSFSLLGPFDLVSFFFLFSRFSLKWKTDYWSFFFLLKIHLWFVWHTSNQINWEKLIRNRSALMLHCWFCGKISTFLVLYENVWMECCGDMEFFLNFFFFLFKMTPAQYEFSLWMGNINTLYYIY